MDHPNVTREKDLEWTEQSRGTKYEFRRKPLGSASGGEKIGCSLYEVPPGKRSWPFHYHLANEEALYILSGKGVLRIGEEEVAVSRGDYVALLPGKTAHQLINNSGSLLRYICISTMIEPDISIYPDSGKIGIFAGSAPGGPREKRTVFKYVPGDIDVDYWEGEEVD